jgi:hypothetical protein
MQLIQFNKVETLPHYLCEAQYSVLYRFAHFGVVPRVIEK